MPRTPHSSLNSRRPSPRRVPPDQSATRVARRRRARRRDRATTARRVMRVSRVPSANASTRPRPTTAACRNRTQRAGVRLHRAAHVAQQHDAARARRPARRTTRLHRLAAGAQRAPHGAAQVGAAAPRARPRAGASAAARRPGGGRPSAGGPRRTPRACTRRSRAWRSTSAAAAAHRQRRAASSSSSASSSAVGVVVAVVERERHLACGAATPSGTTCTCSQHAREHAVVERDVFGAAHQRRPARPVHGVAAAPSRPPPSASANATVAADRHVEPGRPQQPARTRPTTPVGLSHCGRVSHRARAASTMRSTPALRVRSWSSRYLRIGAERDVDRVLVDARCARARRARCAQSMVSATPGGL